MEYFLQNNAPIIVKLLTSANLIEDHSDPIEFKDSLFIYIGSSKWLVPTLEAYGANDVTDSEHNGDGIDFIELDLDLEINARIE